MFSISHEEVLKNTFTDHHGARWIREDVGILDYLRTLRAVRKSFPAPREYLEKIKDKHAWAETWLNYGRTFVAPSKKNCRDISEAGLILEFGKCYANSLVASSAFKEHEDTKDARYVEGFTITPTGPYRHAWVAVDDFVIDPTWPDAHRVSYFGVAFDPEFVMSVARTTGYHSITRNWEKCGDMVVEHLKTLV